MGTQVTKLWQAIAPLRGEAAAEGEGVPPPQPAEAEREQQGQLPVERVPPPRQLATLVSQLPELDEECWRGVVDAARQEPSKDAALPAEVATLLVGCGVVDTEVQSAVVQQCAFLLRQFAKASSVLAV